MNRSDERVRKDCGLSGLCSLHSAARAGRGDGNCGGGGGGGSGWPAVSINFNVKEHHNRRRRSLQRPQSSPACTTVRSSRGRTRLYFYTNITAAARFGRRRTGAPDLCPRFATSVRACAFRRIPEYPIIIVIIIIILLLSPYNTGAATPDVYARRPIHTHADFRCRSPVCVYVCEHVRVCDACVFVCVTCVCVVQRGGDATTDRVARDDPVCSCIGTSYTSADAVAVHAHRPPPYGV